VVIGLGLVTMAAIPSLPGWYAAWTLLGIGMALGLYDAAFATIGRLLGAGSRPTIVGVTMLGGLASSIGWSMGWLVDLVGWQGTALIYAAINLGVNLPLELWLIPRALALPPPVTDIRVAAVVRPAVLLSVFVPLAIFFSLRAAITTIFSVHALWLMQGVGLTAAAAIGALALIGPAQVGIRIVEWFAGQRISPMTTSLLGAGALPVGIGWLLLGGPAVAFAIVWGMSNGILTISRGLLPMYLFGARGYATRLGQIALPALLTQAVAPTLIAPLVAVWPAARVLGVLGIAGVVALLCLLPLCRARAAAQDD
jgi:hypothetical protein